MPRNVARRLELLDAALAVLAEQGARGLTFRAVDERGALPPGTASNYFPTRDALFAELGDRVHVRLEPGPDELAALDHGAAPAASARDLLPRVMRGVLERIMARREIYLALLELRLEATRRPALRAALARTLEEMFAADVARHVDAGFPGGAHLVGQLRHAMDGLILDQLTVPESQGRIDDPGALAEALAGALLTAAEHRTLGAGP